ncbi:hypothetical protein LIA77_10193 [Sarocladium implicatum]|nr:hypothetical protein LIA77_10193 [Sarocladium implicatum]
MPLQQLEDAPSVFTTTHLYGEDEVPVWYPQALAYCHPPACLPARLAHDAPHRARCGAPRCITGPCHQASGIRSPGRGDVHLPSPACYRVQSH